MKIKILLFFIAIVLCSCSSDDDSSSPAVPITNSGYFTVNGTTYQVDHGYLIPPNPESNGRYYIGFADGDISYEPDNFLVDSNVRNWVDFTLYSSQLQTGSIQNTIYNFPPDSSFDMNQAHIFSSEALTNCIFENGNFISGVEHDSDMLSATGSVEVISNNGLYNINFSIVDNAGTPITGSYFGTLIILN